VRAEARLQVSIWSDADWLALSVDAQRAYLLVLSQPGLSLCGVIAYTPRRWATYAAGDTTERLEAAIDELEERRFVVVDRDTEELLIRSFMRRDRVHPKNDKCWRPAMAQREAIVSVLIRGAVEEEVARILAEHNKSQADGSSQGAPDDPSESEAMGDGMGSVRAHARPSSVVRPLSSVGSPPSTDDPLAPLPAQEEFDALKEAACAVCGIDPAAMTSADRKALKHLWDEGVTPDEVRERALRWPQRFPNWKLTLPRLARYWEDLAPRHPNAGWTRVGTYQ
jgi:hypothetical protein